MPIAVRAHLSTTCLSPSQPAVPSRAWHRHGDWQAVNGVGGSLTIQVKKVRGSSYRPGLSGRRTAESVCAFNKLLLCIGPGCAVGSARQWPGPGCDRPGSGLGVICRCGRVPDSDLSKYRPLVTSRVHAGAAHHGASLRRLLTPSFSLYRFVVSRTSGAERGIYLPPFFSKGPANQCWAGPAQAVTLSEASGLTEALPGTAILSLDVCSDPSLV